ncbi:MAG: hypothetical protein HA495_00045 [Thaumarchaeota archaeon]|nr:hypothetical protein [Nitrososphaerota archaeon]
MKTVADLFGSESKNIFDLPVVRLDQNGKFVSGIQEDDHKEWDILNIPLVSVGLKSQYVWFEGDDAKRSPLRTKFTDEEKEKYKAMPGARNIKYRGIYAPTLKEMFVLKYGPGVAEYFRVGLYDTFVIEAVKKEKKKAVTYYVPVIKKIPRNSVLLDEQDIANIKALLDYFPPNTELQEKNDTVARLQVLQQTEPLEEPPDELPF